MASFIKLTHRQGSEVWINPVYVETLLASEGGTRIVMTGTSNRIDVQESLDVVLGLLGVTRPAEAAASPKKPRRAAPKAAAAKAAGPEPQPPRTPAVRHVRAARR